jgi:hypothetical protein
VDFTDLAQQCLGHLSIDVLPADLPAAPDVSLWRLTVTDLVSNLTLVDTYPITTAMRESEMRALESRVRRDLVLKLVPGYLRDQCLQLCRETTRSYDTKHLAEVSRTVLSTLAALGLDNAALKSHLGHSPATLTAGEVEELRGLAILHRQGEITWEQLRPLKGTRAVDPKPATKKPAAAKKPKAPRAALKPAAAAQAAPAPPAPPPATRQSLRDEDDEGDGERVSDSQLS